MRIYRLPPSARALVLDIDGTLYENRSWMDEQNDVLIRRYALERGKTPEEARAIVKGAKILASRDGGESSLANALAYLGIPIETSVAWRRELLEPEAWLEPDPALAAVLADLAASFTLIALTNNPSDIGKRTLAALGLDGVLDEVIGLEHTLRSKPDPAPFRLALERLGLPAEEAISVGDRYEVDMSPALELGMGAVLVDGPADIPKLADILLAGRPPRNADPRAGASIDGTQALSENQPGAPRVAAPSSRPPTVDSSGGDRRISQAGPSLEASAPPSLRARGDAFRLLSLLPSILILALLVAGAVGRSGSSYQTALLDRATDRMDTRTVLDAFHDAYPDAIGRPFRDDDSAEWRVSVRGKDFSWARGRILPAEEADRWDAYRPYISFVYPWTVPDPASYPEDLVERLRSFPGTQADEPGSHGAFAAALYGGMDEDAVWERQVRTSFLGWKVTMHEMAAGPLARVEREILLAATYSSEVKRFVDSIGEVGGYHWRRIRGQKALSYHSFGIAIDLLPKGGTKKRGVYWQWDWEAGDDWVLLPPSKRWAPPEEVVRAFEGNGFCWGGKWLMYDTMHFEYRPELIKLRTRLLPWYLSLGN